MAFKFFYPKALGKNKDSAMLLYQFIIQWVPLLITPAHVVMMRSAQGSDVIWLKGI